MESPFEARAEGKIIREAIRSSVAGDLVARVHCCEWKTRMPIQNVNKVPVLLEPWNGERQPTPGKNAIRHIPGKRSALLRAKQRDCGHIIESGIGSGRRMNVRPKQ